jgi:hypothetical protein
MKQTAVEWFFKALIENQDKTYKQIELILDQAKAMEKQQIIEAYEYTAIGTSNYGEQYYKKTYESNN